jgi:DNA-binding MarR family transcriptional regulator
LSIGQELENDEAVDHRAQTKLWLRLLACATLIESSLRRNFRDEFDFTLPRFEVLAQLDREPGGLVAGELSKRLMVSAGNVTPIIDRLITDGYVTRAPSSLDRRVQIVCLTIEGRRRFRRMAKKHGVWLAALLEELSAGEIEDLSLELARLKSVLSRKTLRAEAEG